MRTIELSCTLETIVQKLLADGDSDAFVEFINLCAAHVKDTHGKQHRDTKKRYNVFIQRMRHAFDEDGELFVGVLAGLQGEK